MGIKVYKASAGSGKTYTLVYEYIRFLFQHLFGHEGQEGRCEMREVWRDMPSLNLHRRILAVTFTNKATAEMKERIVKGLYDLSRGEHKEYLGKLREDVLALGSVADEDVAMCAKRLLTDILQDYTQFRVSTIDGFFQHIVRSFARELNLNNQYQVELDSDSILELAVDNMLASLGEEGSEMLLKWLTEFSTDRVGSDQSWNPRSAILQLAKLTMKELYVLQRERFGFDLNVMVNYRNHLRDVIRKFDEDLSRVCNEAQGVLSGVNALEVFGKNRISFFNYEYLRGKDYVMSDTFRKGADSADLETWCMKKYRGDKSLEVYTMKLHECVKQMVMLCERGGERFREYQTARIVLSRLYVLGILSEIDDRVMDICRTRDCLMISSTTDFINKIIDNSDTPFIYEKVGVTINNFMIDEFQDTSRLQWSNFVPLLGDAVAQGNESMIVGDVKQSIYRWRNGDWRILHEGVDSQFGDFVKHETLGANYRSRKEVIDFNNKLYEELPRLVDEQLQRQKIVDGEFLQNVYKDSSQRQGNDKKNGGYVNVEFVVDDKEREGLTWKDDCLNRMVERMLDLKVFGGMAVLVRKNDEAQLVAKRLKEEGIPFYSSEALCVADNVAVRFVVSVLKYMMQPQEQLYRSNMLALYRELCSGKMVGVEDYELMSYRGDDYGDWEKQLFGEEVAVRFGRLKYLSLLQIIESLVALFELDSVDGGVHGIYLQSFMDKVQSYAIDGVLDIRSLLEYWEIEGEKSFIAMPEGGDAVKIITIHKSKGLEFDIVFIPFMNWMLGLSGLSDIQLASVEDKTHSNHLFIDEVPLVPIDMQASKRLFESEFKSEVVSEFKSMCLDVMNVLYVATTRASQQLYIYCVESKKKEEKKTEKEEKDETERLGKISMTELIRRVLGLKEDINEYKSGDNSYIELKKDDVEVEKVELKRDVELLPTEAEVAERAQLRFNYSEDECEGDMRRYGVLMHKLFEGIEVVEDIDGAIDRLRREGECVEGMRSEVDEILAIAGVAELFDARWRVMNEAEIFDVERGRVYRPDRVVIDEEKGVVVVLDYKFGEYTENLHEKYSRQVGRYVQLIREMGYDVQGYILYVKERKMIKI